MSDGYRGHLATRLVQSHVPEHLHDGLIEYIVARRPTGGFLRACLENDLKEACCRAADDMTAAALPDIVRFLVNYVTAPAWGSREAVEAWLADPSPPREVYE